MDDWFSSKEALDGLTAIFIDDLRALATLDSKSSAATNATAQIHAALSFFHEVNGASRVVHQLNFILQCYIAHAEVEARGPNLRAWH